MSKLFQGIKIKQFETQFIDENACLKHLADLKWKNGYECRKCSNSNYCKGKMQYSRRCTRCKHDESPTAHTIFHRCKINIREAFEIAYQVCCQPGISTYKLAECIDGRQMTCWKFKKKLQDCLEENGKIVLYDPVKKKN